jgi:predicted O-methyltransferase YrrM
MEEKLFGCPVEMLQHKEEISWLIDKVKAAKPVRVLEIGSLFGGTLWCWMQACPTASQFLSIDLIVPEADPRHDAQVDGHKRIWYEWAKQHDHTLDVLESGSTLPDTIAFAKSKMPVVDFLFIDGNHEYEAAKADFIIYSEFVRDGGLIAMHDIGAPDSGGFGTQRLWKELKAKYKTEELVVGDDRGLGLIYKNVTATGAVNIV